MRRWARALGRYTDEITLIGISAFLLAVAIKTQSGWLYALVAFIAGALVSNLAAARVQGKMLTVTRKIPAGVNAGDTTAITIQVANHGRRPVLGVLIEDKFPTDDPKAPPRRLLFEQIDPGRTVTASYEAVCPRRGVFPFPPLTRDAGATLGFFPARRRIPTTDEMVVYPVGPRLTGPALLHVLPDLAFQQRTNRLPGASYDFLGVREYQPSDSIRHIHWPSTAKTGRLMLKEFSHLSAQHVGIFLDSRRASLAGKGNESSLESAIRLAAGVVTWAAGRGNSLLLAAPGVDRLETLTRPDRREALKWLAGLQAAGEQPWDQALAELGRSVKGPAHLICVLTWPHVDAALVGALRSPRVGVSVVLVEGYRYLDPGEPRSRLFTPEAYDALEAALVQLGLPVRRLHPDGHLQATLAAGAARS